MEIWLHLAGCPDGVEGGVKNWAKRDTKEEKCISITGYEPNRCKQIARDFEVSSTDCEEFLLGEDQKNRVMTDDHGSSEEDNRGGPCWKGVQDVVERTFVVDHASLWPISQMGTREHCSKERGLHQRP
jgi:hypothetical protein